MFKAIRITEVVPGKPYMGIETPNKQRETVWLRDVLNSDAFKHSKATLPMALGKDISGEPIVVDMAKMPHLLVAGQTGGGKSVGVNTMILSLLFKLSPEQVRFIMIDPKVVELSIYNDIPHLLTPVVTDMKKRQMLYVGRWRKWNAVIY
ncbi:DNA translocase FtsK [Actinobacillus equuli]|nr:DNA translocase FtsK [Actinobacillus equuli]